MRPLAPLTPYALAELAGRIVAPLAPEVTRGDVAREFRELRRILRPAQAMPAARNRARERLAVARAEGTDNPNDPPCDRRPSEWRTSSRSFEFLEPGTHVRERTVWSAVFARIPGGAADGLDGWRPLPLTKWAEDLDGVLTAIRDRVGPFAVAAVRMTASEDQVEEWTDFYGQFLHRLPSTTAGTPGERAAARRALAGLRMMPWTRYLEGVEGADPCTDDRHGPRKSPGWPPSVSASAYASRDRGAAIPGDLPRYYSAPLDLDGYRFPGESKQVAAERVAFTIRDQAATLASVYAGTHFRGDPMARFAVMPAIGGPLPLGGWSAGFGYSDVQPWGLKRDALPSDFFEFPELTGGLEERVKDAEEVARTATLAARTLRKVLS